MGKIRQIKDEYYVEFYARGLLYQQKAGKDRAKAQELLCAIKQKIAQDETITIESEIDLDIFFAEFLKHARSQYHPATVCRLRTLIDSFLAFISANFPNVTRLSGVTSKVVEEYKAYGIKKRQSSPAGLNPKVINLSILLLREIFEYGIKTGLINNNPTLHVRLLEVYTASVRVMSDNQLSDLLKLLYESYQNALLVIRYTGLRPTELVDLKWDRVDLNRQVIFVRSREVPLLAQAKLIIEKLFVTVIDHKAFVFLGPLGEPITFLELQESFENARSIAELPSDIPLMSLRHAFIIDLLLKRVPFLAIGRISGVSDIAKLMRFASYIPIEMQGEGS